MISVCMATYNGEKYLKEQIDSILPQLNEEDELIVSDDGSTDSTVDIIKSYSSAKIKLFFNKKHGVASNFENALRHSSGEIIFLADQDDVWYPKKISQMKNFLVENNYDIILCNCSLTDSHLNITKEKHFNKKWPMKKNIVQNFINNGWLGTCMAFTDKVKNAILPFPPHIVAHDLWISLFAQIHFRCGYLDKVLVLYRRHENTVSFTGRKSTNPFFFKIKYRFQILIALFYRSISYKLRAFKKSL